MAITLHVGWTTYRDQRHTPLIRILYRDGTLYFILTTRERTPWFLTFNRVAHEYGSVFWLVISLASIINFIINSVCPISKDSRFVSAFLIISQKFLGRECQSPRSVRSFLALVRPIVELTDCHRPLQLSTCRAQHSRDKNYPPDSSGGLSYWRRSCRWAPFIRAHFPFDR